VQNPNSILPKEIVRESHIARTDLLIAEAGTVNLLAHHDLHEHKREKQNSRKHECDFVERHNRRF